MQSVTTIGLDIAKSVFQVHGVDAAGQVIIRRQLKRRYMLVSVRRCSHHRLGGDIGTSTWPVSTGWPSRSDSHCPIRRARMSVPPPGGKPTTIRTGRDG